MALGAALLALALTGPAPVEAQEEVDTAAAEPPATQAEVVDTILVEPPAVSPGNAFLRALAIPGWGHASIGSYSRGGFYFLSESAAVWMMIRTRRRIGAARDVRELREAEVVDELAQRGVTSPDSIRVALENSESVDAAGDLVEAREQQFEDWLALGIFLFFLSGADAFVSAHLANFPEPVDVNARMVSPRAVELQVAFPVGGR